MANRTGRLHVGSLLIFYNNLYGNVIYEIREMNLPCRNCGGNDGYKIAVIADNGVGLIQGEEYRLPDARVGTTLVDCLVKLESGLNPLNWVDSSIEVVPEDQIERIKEEILKGDQ